MTPTQPQSADATKTPELNGDDGVKAVEAAAAGTANAKQQQTATDWFMSTDAEEVAWAWIDINVAPAGAKEKLVPFKIQVVDRDRIRDLRKQATVEKANGTEEIDEMEANLQIAVEGLLEPDLRNKPELRTVRGQEFLDPADALRARFAYKPGIIDQIAGRVVQISGYNDKDVKEVRAAGNS